MTFLSTKPPVVPNRVPITRLEPSGFTSPTFDEQHVDVPIVTPLRLTRWPAVPANVSCAFWPGAPTVTLTGGPFGVIEPVTSSGTV